MFADKKWTLYDWARKNGLEGNKDDPRWDEDYQAAQGYVISETHPLFNGFLPKLEVVIEEKKVMGINLFDLLLICVLSAPGEFEKNKKAWKDNRPKIKKIVKKIKEITLPPPLISVFEIDDKLKGAIDGLEEHLKIIKNPPNCSRDMNEEYFITAVARLLKRNTGLFNDEFCYKIFLLIFSPLSTLDDDSDISEHDSWLKGLDAYKTRRKRLTNL